MISWTIALGLGLALAFVSYGRPRTAPAPFALRTLAGTLAAALLLNAPLGPTRGLAPWIALDASQSWSATGDSTAWRAAIAAADAELSAGGDSLLLFGDSVRGGLPPALPTDGASRVEPLVERARALGRPVVIVTDGQLDDAERLADLPRGSRVVTRPAPDVADLAIAALDAPRAVVIADTLEVRLLLRAAGGGAAARQVSVQLGGRFFASAELGALNPFEERSLLLRAVVPALEGEQTLVAALAPGDPVAGNDTASAALNVAGVASVALVSTAPDQDARFAHAVLRSTQRGAVRAYWRVAPGQWREGEALRPVAEATVRRALAQASLVLLHGDTAYFGAPRLRAAGAMVLMPTPSGLDEYYATGAGDSPVRAALAELPWDELPPLRAGIAPGGGLRALVARRARRGEERALVTLVEGNRKVAIVSAAGFWRWRTRGGRSADAFNALWGSIFDWAAAVPDDGSDGADAARIAHELLPRPALAPSGAVGTAPARDLTPRARGAWWLALLALLALCGEWVMRRRFGWR